MQVVNAPNHQYFLQYETDKDRKEAYIERKQQMKADLPKTSYSKMEEANKSFNATSYSANGYNTYGINGDNAAVTSAYDEKVTCKYCGAENIVPRSRAKKYNCYFCVTCPAFLISYN